MKLLQITAASLLALAAAATQAQVTFAFGSDAESQGNAFDYAYPDRVVNGNLYSTGGPVTASAGAVQATVNAWADGSTGLFKAITQVNLSGGKPTNIGQTYARLDIADTLRFSGPGSTVNARFSLSYDTVFSGVGFEAFERAEGDYLSHFMQAASSRSIAIEYVVANPSYNPNLVCRYDGDFVDCPLEAQPYLYQSERAYKDLDAYMALSEPGNASYTYSIGNAGNGHYTGTVTLDVVLPTNVDVRLDYFAINSARCFHLSTCALTVDASHSDYLGIAVEGGSFASANGYQYLGLPSAVPEPQTYALLLAGLALVGGVARRRR